MGASELWRRIKHFVQRDRVTRELEEEMRLHLEMRAERIGAEAAQRRFGNSTVIQQQSRDAWGFMRLEEVKHDVQFAARRIWKSPPPIPSWVQCFTCWTRTNPRSRC